MPVVVTMADLTLQGRTLWMIATIADALQREELLVQRSCVKEDIHRVCV